MPDTVFIYALNCPITGRTRYVGKAKDPKERLIRHKSEAKRERNYRTNWLRSLYSQGLAPLLEILDEVSEAEWPSWEAAYIQFFREEGFALVNGTLGGESPPIMQGSAHPMFGKPRTLEQKLAHSRRMSGEKHFMFGKHHSDEARASRSRALSGRVFSEEAIHKMSRSKLGVVRGPYKKRTAKISAEGRARMALGQQNRRLREKEQS